MGQPHILALWKHPRSKVNRVPVWSTERWRSKRRRFQALAAREHELWSFIGLTSTQPCDFRQRSLFWLSNPLEGSRWARDFKVVHSRRPPRRFQSDGEPLEGKKTKNKDANCCCTFHNWSFNFTLSSSHELSLEVCKWQGTKAAL